MLRVRGFEGSRPQRIDSIFPTPPLNFQSIGSAAICTAQPARRQLSMYTGVQSPVVQCDLGVSQRLAQPCHLHLTCAHIDRRAIRNAARSSVCRGEAPEAAAGKHCLSHSSRKQERKRTLSTCAVANEVRETAVQGSTESDSNGAASTVTQELKPEAAAVVAEAASGPPETATEQASAPHAEQSTIRQDIAAEQPDQAAAPLQAPSDAPSTASAPPSQRSELPHRAPYRGYKNMRRNSFQKGPDSNSRLDMGSRINKGPRPIPIPPEEADWLLPERTVTAKVVYSNHNGFKVEMVKDPRVSG